MNPRIVGLILFIVGLAASWFMASAETGKVMGLFLAFVAGCGLYQMVFGFQSFGSAFSNLGSDTSSQMRRLLGILVLAGGTIGVSMLSGDKAEELRKKELTEHGVVATAVITDGYESKRRRGGTSYNLKIKYADQSGVEHELEKGVSSEHYQFAAIGMPLEIIYSSEKPEVMEILWDDTDKAQYGK